MVRSVVDKGLFTRYSVNDNISFPILKFANDTILLCEASWDNLWTIKTIFRSFELVSGLKVNFFKSCMLDINTDAHFLNCASDFLSCSVGNLPFKFLGIPVAANPRRTSTWDPIALALKKKIQSWKGRFLSIGERITIINLMLNSLPLHFLSFYRAPEKVVKSFEAIQRRFLWGGCEDSKEIYWVSWKKVCVTSFFFLILSLFYFN